MQHYVAAIRSLLGVFRRRLVQFSLPSTFSTRARVALGEKLFSAA